MIGGTAVLLKLGNFVTTARSLARCTPHFSYESPVNFMGSWSLIGEQLLLTEASRPNGTAKEISAKAFFYKQKPAFARDADIEGDKIHEWWVYKRKDSS